MAKLNAITKYLNDELKVKKISDFSKNGLQVRCKPEVKRIGFAVDGCISTFEKAKKAKVDLLVVHHGVKWAFSKSYAYGRPMNKTRLEWLKKNNMSLYCAHLPLDLHKKYGNNIELATLLDLKEIKKFGYYHGKPVGYSGKFNKPVSIGKLVTKLNKKLKTKCVILNHGKKMIKSIGIVSGGGESAFLESIKKGLDCFLVGEMNHGNATQIRDYKYNSIIAGHYATETLGVKALMKPIKEKFGVEVVFIDNAVDT